MMYVIWTFQLSMTEFSIDPRTRKKDYSNITHHQEGPNFSIDPLLVHEKKDHSAIKHPQNRSVIVVIEMTLCGLVLTAQPLSLILRCRCTKAIH
jgi:hypothetical protein